MADQEDYKSIWLRKLNDFWAMSEGAHNYRRHIKNPNELFAEIERAIEHSMRSAGVENEQINSVMESLREHRGYTDSRAVYRGIIKRHNDLLNIETQVRKSDIESKFRFLIFRVLTAIFIAAVILGAGYVAHRAGIPIPLLRMPA